MMQTDIVVWPVEIRLESNRQWLEILFEDEKKVRLSAEMLRVNSPSAEVQGHAPHQRVLVTGKQDIKIEQIEPVGNYAIRLLFDDGHDTGLYSWKYLYELSEAA